ncbi:hypothetical protein LCGC14_0700600 [marine sediment metagenome]|uniref:HopJ type III effector protein n=1 Tax=marine sediment metagenome TaxID=412755 RepID=A0A0F9QMK1_9ZZZZ|nr:type III effector [Methylophaga sp.]
MNIDEFIVKLTEHPELVEFSETMAVIDENYDFIPVKFTNNHTVNEANENNGSCKIFAFGLLHSLSKQQTLACFGSYYRDDVLAHPEADDHQNIRNFIEAGWDGIHFSNAALVPN